jgi:hypothetical protein
MSDNIIQGTFRPRPPGLPSRDARTPESKKTSKALVTTREDWENKTFGGDPAKAPPDEQSGHFITCPDGTTLKLSAEQIKVLDCIMSDMAFIFIGIKPTERGADFYRALHGSPEDLRNAYDHLSDQIEKAYHKKGLL